MSEAQVDYAALWRDYVDFLVPRLDTYEQALYVYLLRHTHLAGSQEVTIGFKSARRKMGFGIGEKGKPMSEGTCYEKLRSLHAKGCINVIDTTRDGTKLCVILPSEMPDLIPARLAAVELSIEDMDFFTVAKNRAAILKREGNRCFYCLRQLTSNNHIIEHVTAREDGGNGYRNVVAACRNCNNRKNAIPVDDFLRILYREGLLSPEDFAHRTSKLERLRGGQLKPVF